MTDAMARRLAQKRRYEAKRDFQQEYRASKEHWHYQRIRLDHDDAQMLKAIAKRRKTSVAELIRTYVTWGLMEDDGARRSDDL